MTTLYHVKAPNEDGSRSTVVAVFARKKDADKLAARVPGAVVEEGPVVYDNYRDYQENNVEAVRERALAKLSKTERKVLNLT